MESFSHKPVMVAEVLAALNPQADRVYLDGTLGGGGHSEAILEKSGPNGRLLGCDRDGVAIAAATERLGRFAGRTKFWRGSFAELDEWIAAGTCDGVLLDLGVSSPQLDRPERGFSFARDGVLDMRMDDRQTMTAAELVNEASREELARIFREWGGEREAGKIAWVIERERQKGRIATTAQLANLIEGICPRRGAKTHPATKVFQAIRIAVNDEIGMLRRGLPVVWNLLKKNGRLAVITFHSLEDRMVKEFGRERSRDYVFPGEVDVPELRRPVQPEGRWVSRKAIQPSDEEVRENPRSRSAQLRVIEKV